MSFLSVSDHLIDWPDLPVWQLKILLRVQPGYIYVILVQGILGVPSLIHDGENTDLVVKNIDCRIREGVGWLVRDSGMMWEMRAAN
jgi:hypothetical protein